MQLSFLTAPRTNNAEGATPALMSLRKARLAYYSESAHAEILNLPKIKELTGQEIMGGRGLYKEQENFQPVCQHIVTSNYDFEIMGNDDGTWRRLRKLKMKIKFCKKNVDKYDEKNPYERLSNSDFGIKWQKDPEIKSSFLSILCHYYMILKNKYEGIIENIPHPHIEKETEEFRNKQDKINVFLSGRLVKLPDVTSSPINRKFTNSDSDNSDINDDDSDAIIVSNSKAKKSIDKIMENDDSKISMDSLARSYLEWHASTYRNAKQQPDVPTVIGQFENSKLTTYIRPYKHMSYISGFRILESGTKLNAGEILFADLIMNSNATKKQYIQVKKESAKEYYERICDEYKKASAMKKEKELEHKNKTNLANVKTGIDNLSINEPSSYKKSIKPLELNEYDKSGIKILKQTDTTNCKEFAASSDEESSSENDNTSNYEDSDDD
jgi:hypothetical protein